MANDKEEKGYRVIDRRGGEEPSAAPAPPPAAPAAAPEGNPGPAAGVQEEKSGAGIGAERPAPQFLDLVESLQMGVMANLGLLQLPDGKRSTVNLKEAQNILDILGILQEKTKGNLEEAEDRVLREGLYQLRMAYVTVQKATIPDLGGGR